MQVQKVKSIIMEQQPEKLERIQVAALDEILGKPFKVLNDGFVRLIDYLGSDSSIVQAARVSYGKGTRKIQEDRGLIRYLLRHDHTTPFEMCEIKLHLRVPMDCWRQWIRHRTANINEYSTRYSVAIDAMQTTQPDEWRLQAQTNRQGSEGLLDVQKGTELSQQEQEIQDLARKLYEQRLELGVAREQARKDLPLSTFTEAYWKIDLHNLLHFLELRMAANAQYEIRQYANTIGQEIVKRWCPLSWEAFQDYRIEALSLSRLENEIIKALNRGDKEQAIKLAEEFGWLAYKNGKLTKNIERGEVEEKLKKLNFPIPWAD
jgi:thymidylate synthase (FAD)